MTPAASLFPDVSQQVAMNDPEFALRSVERATHIDDARTDANYFIAASGCIYGLPGESLPYNDTQGIYISSLQYAYNLPIRRHVGYMAPPGLGKSVQTRAFICWAMGNKPDLKTCIISAELKLAARSVTLCRDVVDRGIYRVYFPDAIPDTSRDRNKKNKIKDDDFFENGNRRGWTMKEWYFRIPGGQAVDPTMSADAAEPTGESRRPDILYADDCMSRAICASTLEMNRNIKALRETWIDGRLSNNGMCIVNHNCWRPDDAFHQLIGDTRFISIKVGVNDDCDRLFVRIWNADPGLPVVRYPDRFNAVEVDPLDGADVEYEVKFPENRVEWTREFLLVRAKNDPDTFRRAFKCKPQAIEDLMYPHWPARRQPVVYPAQLIGCGETEDHIPTPGDMHRMRWLFAAGLDWSGKNRRGKALTILAKDTVTGLIVLVYHSRIKTRPDQPGRMQIVVGELDRAWNLGIRWQRLNGEDNATQDELNDSIRILGAGKDWVYTIADFTTGRNKMDVINGLPPIDIKLEMGQLVWPSGMAAVNPDWALLEYEMANLQHDIKRGETPDGPMSLWFAMCALDMPGSNADPDEASAIPSEATTSMERMGF